MLINLFPNNTSVSIEHTATISITTSGGRSRAIERADQMQHQNHSKTSSHTTTRRGVRLSCSRMQLHSCKRETWLEDNVLADLYTEGFNTAEKFTNQENFKTSVIDIFESFINKRKDAFEAQITQETE